MAIDRIKVGSTNHDLEARGLIAYDLDDSIEKKSKIIFCTKDKYDDLTTVEENAIYFIR